MDPTTTSGPVVAVLGIGTVFVALALLIAVVTLIARLINGPGASADKPAAAAGSVVTPEAASRPGDEDAGPQLLLVALAAYGMHRSRRVSVRGPNPTSSWGRQGRSRQVLRAERTR